METIEIDFHQTNSATQIKVLTINEGLLYYTLTIRENVTDVIGRNERIRTSDPYNPIVVRYQAAPRSEITRVF